jgi:hypothetical protein
MATLKVGGDIDAVCNKCKMTLGHTILAMVGTKVARVRCNTCGGDHAFRSVSLSDTKKPRATPAPRPTRTVVTFDELVAGKDPASARGYSPKETFAVGELVSHPTFGLGLVAAVRGEKVDITFRSEQRTLVHGRGEAGGAARPAFQGPAVPSTSPADKQPKDDVGSAEPVA